MLTFELELALKDVIDQYQKYGTVSDNLMSELIDQYGFFVFNESTKKSDIFDELEMAGADLMTAQVNDDV